jgi:hypothetical protein
MCSISSGVRKCTAIVSLGVNDGESTATTENLTRLRGCISADVVIG